MYVGSSFYLRFLGLYFIDGLPFFLGSSPDLP